MKASILAPVLALAMAPAILTAQPWFYPRNSDRSARGVTAVKADYHRGTDNGKQGEGQPWQDKTEKPKVHGAEMTSGTMALSGGLALAGSALLLGTFKKNRAHLKG